MSLLKLAPEVTRLRRIAKACAAGELSRTEYRQARRAVIEEFSVSHGQGLEDTVPRFDVEITQRRNKPQTQPVQTVSRQNSLTWILLFVLVLAALILPLWSFAQTSTIGPLNSRDPNPQTSPRFMVEQITWTSSVALDAELEAQANALVEQSLAQVQAENAPADHGFSEAELLEVGRFLNAVGVHDQGVVLNRRDLEDLRALIAQQKGRRGVSLLQIERVAADLQQWLRSQGYPLARAYVPAQAVSGGQVQVDVELGLLSEITVAGQTGSQIGYGLAQLLGEPVQRDAVETQLNRLNRASGMSAQASFEAGAAVGQTRMVLHVDEQRRFTGSVGLDNYALDDLGGERLLLAGQWHNPRGVGDVLSAKLFTTVDPADHLYGALGYTTAVGAGKYDLSAQVAFADLELDGLVPFAGEGVLLDLALRDTQVFTRRQSREWVYLAGLHDLNWDLADDQRSWFLGAGWQGHQLWDKQKWAMYSRVDVLFGGVDNTRPGQDSQFWRLGGQLDAWTPLSLPGLPFATKWLLNLRWQATSEALPATLRLNAAGPYANKGFEQAAVVLDQGLGISSALRFNAPVGDWWVFVDATYGELLGQPDQWAQLTSAGLGWETGLLRTTRGRLSSRVTLGYPLAHEGSKGVDEDGTQIFWSIQYEH